MNDVNVVLAYMNRTRTTLIKKRKQIIALWLSGVKQTRSGEAVGLSSQTVSIIVSK